MVVGKEIHFSFFNVFEVATLSVLPVHEKGPGTSGRSKVQVAEPMERDGELMTEGASEAEGGRMIVAPLAALLSKSLFSCTVFFPIKVGSPLALTFLPSICIE